MVTFSTFVMLIKFLIGVPLGAVLYRLRGGPLKDWYPNIFGTQLSRLVWALPTGILMWYITGVSLWLLPVLIVSHFMALVLIGTGQYLEDVPIRFPDGLGALRTAIAASPIIIASPILFVAYALSGSLHALLYWAGFRSAGKNPKGGVFIGAFGSQYGELYVGALCWFVILLFGGI